MRTSRDSVLAYEQQRDDLLSFVAMGSLIGGLSLLLLHSFLLFHSVIESISVIVAVTVFVISWNARKFLSNGFYLAIGVGLLCSGALDLLHTLAYSGMGVFPGDTRNFATQFWIAARYVQSVSLLVALAFLRRPAKEYRFLIGYTVVFVLLVTAIFYFRIFPTCYGPDGLTPFKKASEYIVIAILAASLFLMRRQREALSSKVMRWMSVALIAAMVSEFCFTLYVEVYGFFNIVGHVFKLASVALIYRALVEHSLREPYDLIFRELSESRERIQRARDDLELQVQQRTSELHRRALQLQAMSMQLTRAEQQERKRLAEILHDHLQQLLVAANYNLATLRNQLSERAHKDSLAYTVHLISEAVQSARSLSVELSPRVLYEDGLCPALAWLTGHMKEKYGLDVELKGGNIERIEDEDLNVLLFQSVRELLFNTIKHAGSMKATLEVYKLDHEVINVIVSDSGCGFDPAEVEAREHSAGGFGLFSIRERLDALGGTVEIDSALGKGCRVRLTTPLRRPAVSSPPEMVQ